MPKEKKVKYFIQGVPTDAQLHKLIDKLIADEAARKAGVAKAKAKPELKPKQT